MLYKCSAPKRGSGPDAASALNIAREFPPEFDLIDIGLPVMDGYELARRVRAEFHTQPLTLIAVIGYGQECDRAESRAARFDHHLVKPIDLGQLGELLGEDK